MPVANGKLSKQCKPTVGQIILFGCTKREFCDVSIFIVNNQQNYADVFYKNKYKYGLLTVFEYDK